MPDKEVPTLAPDHSEQEAADMKEMAQRKMAARIAARETQDLRNASGDSRIQA